MTNTGSAYISNTETELRPATATTINGGGEKTLKQRINKPIRYSKRYATALIKSGTS